MNSRRIFVEKKPAFRVEAESLRKEFNENLSVNIRSLRLVNLPAKAFKKGKNTIGLTSK